MRFSRLLPLTLLSLLAAGAGIADAPDGVRAVIRYQQRPVLSHSDTDGSSPDVPIVDHKSGHKIFVFAAGPACLVQGNAYQLVSDAYRLAPRAVLGGSTGRRRVVKEPALCRHLQSQEDARNGEYRCG